MTNFTALHLACRKGHTDVVIALLNRLPALLAIDDSPKGTSLHIAAREGHVEIVKNLLAVAARSVQLKSLERPNSDAGKSDVSLYGSGNERVQKNLELLDSLGEVTVDIMAPTVKDKRTPLHEAAAGGHVQVVRLIVDFMREYYSGGGGGGGGGRRRSGAGLSPRPPERDSAAASPVRLDHSPRVPGRGAAQGKKTKAVPGIDLMTLRGKTALHEAAHEGHFDVMMVLLEAGADINAYMKVSLDITANPELTALVQACLMNRADIVRFLLKNGATDARLKALARTLRLKYDNIAGLLLCYNGGVEPVTDVSHSKAAREAASAKLTLLSALWNSKQLHYVRKGWFQTVCREIPVPESQTAVISQVDISSNNLVDLPLALFQLKHITQLDFSRNKITELPLEEEDDPQHGWACPKLSVLDMSSNQLTSLPSALFCLRELKDLNANSNLITEVPECVWTAPKLCKLYLNKNKLETFPTSSSLSNHSPHVKIPSADSITVSGERSRESGYQSGLPVSLNPSSSAPLLPDSPRLASSGGAKSMSDSQGTFEDSMIMGRSMWSRRRKSAGLGSILSSKGSRRGATFGRDRDVRRNSIGSATQQSSFISWRFKNFQDSAFEVEDLDDLDPEGSEEGSETFPLEHLDLSHNQLTSVPQGLSCLAPKLQKLNLSHNHIRNLRVLCDYPPDLELLDASSNELCATIMEPAVHIYVSCARKALLGMISSSMLTESVAPPYKSCSHRLHKNLRKLSTVRLSHNQLVDVQLFRMVNRNRSGDLTTSIEESVTAAANQRTNTMGDPFAVRVSPGPSGRKELLSKSMSAPARDIASPNPRHSVHRVGSGDSPKGGRNGSNSSNSGGSQEEVTVQSPSSVILSPLYPMLSTLELAHNKLHNVPNNLHLVSTLACLVINHNPIETLPLELSNLDHLWNLEYEGCNLMSPPKQDLDKYRLAADKLLYMKSLLHE